MEVEALFHAIEPTTQSCPREKIDGLFEVQIKKEAKGLAECRFEENREATPPKSLKQVRQVSVLHELVVAVLNSYWEPSTKKKGQDDDGDVAG